MNFFGILDFFSLLAVKTREEMPLSDISPRIDISYDCQIKALLK